MGLLRKLLWAIAKMMLSLSDMAYDLINLILKVDFTNNSVINNMLKFFNIFIVLAVSIRIIIYFIKVINSDTESFESAKVLQGLGRVAVAVTLVPSLLWFSLSLPNTIVKVFDDTFTFSAELKPSTSIVTSLAYTDISGDIKNYEYNKGNVVTVDDISNNINQKKYGLVGQYTYFNGLAELLLVMIVSILVTIALLLNVSMFITRFFVIMYRYLLSFLPISSLVIPNNSDSFFDFTKSIISDITVQTFSAIGFKFVFALNMSNSLAEQNGIVKILFFVLGLTGVVMIGNIISTSIGATDLGNKDHIGKTLLGVSSTMALKSSMNIASDVIQSGAELGLDLASGGVSALGESLGAKGIDDDNGNDIFDDFTNTDDDQANQENNSSPFDDVVDDNQNNDDIFDDIDDDNDIFDDIENEGFNDDIFDDFKDSNNDSLYGNIDDDLNDMSNADDLNDMSNADDLNDMSNADDSNLDNNDTIGFGNNAFNNNAENDLNSNSDLNANNGNSKNNDNLNGLDDFKDSNNDSIDDLNERLDTQENNGTSSDDNNGVHNQNADDTSDNTHGHHNSQFDSAFDNNDNNSSNGFDTQENNGTSSDDSNNGIFGTNSNDNDSYDTDLGGSGMNNTNFNDTGMNDSNFNDTSMNKSINEDERLTRPDTFARQLADNVNKLDNPILNLGSKVTSHFYVKSQNRYNQSKIKNLIDTKEINHATTKDFNKNDKK